MDGSTFDRLSALVGSGSRRLALRTALGGAAVAAAGALASVAGSDAKKRKKCKKKLKKCKKKRKTCPACQAKLVGEEYTSTSECCGTETNMACALASNPPPSDLKTVCCGTATAPCTVDDDCCFGFECNVLSGQCVFAPS